MFDPPIDRVIWAPIEVNTVDNFDAHFLSSIPIAGFKKFVVTRILVRLNEPGEFIRFRELGTGNVDDLHVICWPYETTTLSASQTRLHAHAHFKRYRL